MSAPSFTYSGNVYTAGTAGTVDFALTSTTGNPIPYLEPGHIHVYKSANQGTSWTELTRPAQWDFVTSGTVARLAAGIAAGEWVKVQRITPSSSAYVTFQPSSLLTADQLNDDTLFNTYLNQELYDQGNQSAAIAASAETAAAAATTAATTATSTANSALAASASATTTANNALSASASATTASNTALSQSSTALSNSASAVTTANTASTNAATALSQSAAAVTTANNSQTVANTASTNSTNAVNTANTAASNASTALSQSNTALSQSSTALSQSSTALSQSSTALTNSSSAVSTANTANTNATAALNAVAAAVQYVLVANVAAIPASPTNGYAIEVVDSTGIESFSPVTNRPAGFIGDLGLSIRMQYSTTGPTWNWLGYFANNPEDRYLKLSGGTLTGQLKADDSTSTAAPVYAFDGDTNTGIAHTGADELALVTGGTARLTIDGSGNVAVPGGLTKGGSNVVTVGDTGTVTSAMLADGTIVNADVNTSAAIAGTKISPDFGSQNVTTTGTATAAALIPTSSSVPTNGVYLPSSNNVAISTNGTGRLFIDASGRVGLGVTTPGTTLDLGSGTLRIRNAPGDSNGLQIYQDTSDVSRIYNFYPGPIAFGTNNTERMRLDSSGRLGLGSSSPSELLELSATADPRIRFVDVGNADAKIGFYSSSRLGFEFAGTERMSINSTGVGIGSNSPQVELDVNGRIRLARDNFLQSSDGAGGWVELIKADTSNNTVIRNNKNTAIILDISGNEAARIDGNRRLLVGTSTARSNLYNSNNPLVQFETTGSSIPNNWSAIANRSDQYGPEVVIGKTRGTTVNSVTAVQSGDSLGIIQFLGADGTTLIRGASIAAEADGGVSTNDLPSRLVFSTTADGASSPTERLRIQSSGDLRIANSTTFYPATDNAVSLGSGPTGPFRFSAVWAANGTIQTSDERDKTDVVNAQLGSDFIKSLRPVSYKWIEGGKVDTGERDEDGNYIYESVPGTRTHWGFIAQEVKQAVDNTGVDFGGWVLTNKDDPDSQQALRYDQFIAPLTKALQETMAELEALKAEVAALKGA